MSRKWNCKEEREEGRMGLKEKDSELVCVKEDTEMSLKTNLVLEW